MNYNDIFSQRYNKLNAEQKKAVDTLFGPVMVVAGPGTGKTEVLAARIANILRSPEAAASANNILCLTYTEAGVIAMRKRLQEFIGPDAYKVTISTFHGFCNDIIQNNLDIFGKREVSPLSDLEKVEIMQEIIDGFSTDNPLFSASGYYEISRLSHLFQTMKQENWTVEGVLVSIKEYEESLPGRSEFQYKRAYKGANAGDINPNKMKQELQKLHVLRSAVQEFSVFEEKMMKRGLYDYADMILWVIQKWKEFPELLAESQERYQFILVDEFQDTNGAQKEVLSLLSSYWDEPNVFIVGDDDQSIFRFQGANLRNIMSFYDDYKDSIQFCVLDKNYRSSQKILDTASSLIEVNQERLIHELPGMTKDLKASHPEVKDLEKGVELHIYQNITQEEVGVLSHIEILLSEGVEASNIAVLYKQHRQSENMIKLCEQRKIDVQVKETINILDERFIQNIVKILEYFRCEKEKPFSGDHLLFHILSFPFFQIPAFELAKLFAFYSRNRREKSWMSIRELFHDDEAFDELQLPHAQDLLAIIKLLELTSSEIHEFSLLEWIERLFSSLSILPFALKHEKSTFMLRLLSTFFQYIKNQCAQKSSSSLEDILKNFENMQNHGITIPLTKSSFSPKGVHFITTHSSKGLEFDYVFIIGCSAKAWDKKQGSRFQYFYPDTLTRSNAGDDKEEMRRLFYTALTRAKRQVFLSYSKENAAGKGEEESQFIAEICSRADIESIDQEVSDEKVSEFYEGLLTVAPESNSRIDHNYIDEILQNYSLSSTDINKYLRCPVAFYYENILRVPSAMNEYMAFGNAMHYALEHFFIDSKRAEKILGLEILLEHFQKGLFMNKEHFTEELYARRKEYGAVLLKEYFEKYSPSWNTFVVIEYSVTGNMGNIGLKGRFDMVQFLEPGKVSIIDYKTGKCTPAKLRGPSPKDENGGDYWRQMVFYKILLDSDGKNQWHTQSVILDFLEKNASGEFERKEVVISQEDESLVREQIKNTHAKIMNHEFSFGCNKEECFWCEFEKNL